jgi:Cation transport ATPase
MMYSIILNGLDCASCATKIEEAISKISNIDNVSVNFITSKLSFSCDKNNLEAVNNEIKSIINKLEPDIEMVFK